MKFNQKQRREPEYSEFQKFLEPSTVAPSQFLKFMPLTYPGVPAYYQLSLENMHRGRAIQNQTIEIQDLVADQTTRHENHRYLQVNFPTTTKQPQQALDSQLYNKKIRAAQSILQHNSFMGNISKMPDYQDPTLRSFNYTQEVSLIGFQQNNQTNMKIEENILNQINMKDEVDKAYRKLIS